MRHVGVVLSVVCLLATAGVVLGDVHVNVPSDYPTIQAAINSLDPADLNRIYLAPGVYNECITVDRTVIIIGHGEDTILRAPRGSTEPVITVIELPEDNDRFALKDVFVKWCANSQGAIVCKENSWSVIEKCIITGSASAGIHTYFAAGVMVKDCNIHKNAGHGVEMWMPAGQRNHIVERCDIHHNGKRGVWVTLPGGLGSGGELPMTRVSNCVIRNNSGGGVELLNELQARIRYCTIVQNNAPTGAGISVLGPGKPRVEYCIVASNVTGEGIFVASAATAVVSHCDFFNNQGGAWSGADCQYDSSTCFSEDPLFANPAGGDYHLKSTAGRWDPAEGIWVNDAVTSPCIDAAAQAEDIGAEPDPNGGIPNIGAYGWTTEASKTPPDGTGRDKGRDQGKEKPEEGTDRKIRQRPKPGR